MKHPKDLHCGQTFYHCVSGVCIKMHAITEPYKKNDEWVWKARDRLGNVHDYLAVDEPHEYLYDYPIHGFHKDRLL